MFPEHQQVCLLIERAAAAPIDIGLRNGILCWKTQNGNI